MNYQSNSVSAQPSQPAVSAAFERCMRAAEALHGSVGDITGRIESICTPPDETSGEVGATPSYSVQMADKLITLAELIEGGKTRLDKLYNRVSL